MSTELHTEFIFGNMNKHKAKILMTNSNLIDKMGVL